MEGRVFRRAFKRKEKLPDQPEIPTYLEFAAMAYFELATCRIYDDGPIPCLAVYEWCERFGLSEEETYNLRSLIDDTDLLIRQYRRKKNKAELDKLRKKRPKTGRRHASG